MGFFDRFADKKPAPRPAADTTPPSAAAPPASAAGSVLPRLIAARARLEAKDLPGAVAIYEEVLAVAGDRADVLVTISGDLGSCGQIVQIIDLVAPRYDAALHGPATGLNVLQAYLAARDTVAAQHVLDVLFALNRPELEERLHGFSNAIAEIIAARHPAAAPDAGEAGPGGAPAARAARVSLASVSKPIWFYGLEAMAAGLLPPKDNRQRALAFAQLALPGAYPDLPAAMLLPADELGLLSRALPLWLADSFYFSTAYNPIAAVGLYEHPESGRHPALFGSEWTTENLRQLVETTDGGLDYVFTGAMRRQDGTFEVILRLWEVKKLRERKTFSARWTAANADAVLARLQAEVCGFMEWKPDPRGLPYVPTAQPRVWLDTLASSLSLFFTGKGVWPKEILTLPPDALDRSAAAAATSPAAALAWLTLATRAKALGASFPTIEPPLADHPLVSQARQLLTG